MKILWVINSLLPEMAIAMGYKHPISYSNSWVIALLAAIKADIDLTIVMFYKGNKMVIKKFEDYICVAIPNNKVSCYNEGINSYLEMIKGEFDPDIVHVHGSEFPHVFNILQVFDCRKVVISVQGLISIISKYYFSNLRFWEIFRNLTLRNIFLGDSVWGQKKSFERRGYYEQLAIKNACNVIGRTLWDMVHIQSINPNIKYFHLDELLRIEFYKSRKWSYEKCHKHTIFISQCSYPIKGLHIALKALYIVKQKYPDVILRIAGKPFLNCSTIKEKIGFSGYAKYIRGLIRKYNLKNQIEFTGILCAQEMIDEYLNSNIYICPSCIENSPNSMCEAQFLGVPSVLSYCGGIPDMTKYGSSAFLYRFEEYEMLAYYINLIFSGESDFEQKTKAGINIAERRHKQENIFNGLLKIYNSIYNETHHK